MTDDETAQAALESAQGVIDAALPDFKTSSPDNNDRLRKAIAIALVVTRKAGMMDAAEYVDGNWSDAKTMAAHLRAVVAGEKPMYGD